MASNFIRFLLALVAATSCLASTPGSASGGYASSHQPYANDPYYQERSQQPPQQGAPGHYSYPPQFPQGPPPPMPPQPSQYPPGTLMPYRRGPPPPPPQEGFFSKLKNSVINAGTALMGSLEGEQEHPSYRPPGYPPAPANRQPSPPPPGYPQPPQPYGSYPPRGPAPASYPYRPPATQQEEGGLMGKIKGLFGADDQPQSQQQQAPPKPAFGNYPPPPPPGFGPRPSAPSQSPPAGQFGREGGSFYNSDYSPRYEEGKPSPHQGFPSDTPSSHHFSSSPPSPPSQPQSYPPRDFYPPDQAPPSSYPQAEERRRAFASPGFPPEDLSPLPAPPTFAPQEPQAFVHEDGSTIVFVHKPHELERKKRAMESAGTGSLQVLGDFDRAFVKSRGEGGGRLQSNAELLENSGVLSPECLQRMRQVTDEMDREDWGEDGSVEGGHSEEQLFSQLQQIISRYGQLSLSNVPLAVKSFLSLVGLRDGWKDVVQTLTQKQVPLFLFSAGYGDVIAHAFLQGGLSPPSNAPRSLDASLLLPPNLRIISNFMRAGPDGFVRAFSSPIIHSGSKNATTASLFLHMPLPERPYAIVLGGAEEDVHMTEGLEGLQEQISIGFLEVSEDLPQRLPSFLTTFDVVLVGDCPLNYVKSLLEDILQLPHSKHSEAAGSNNPINKLGLSFGLRRLLGNNEQQQPQSQPIQQTHQPQLQHASGQYHSSVPPGYSAPPSAAHSYSPPPHNSQSSYPNAPQQHQFYPPSQSQQGQSTQQGESRKSFTEFNDF